MMLPNAPDATGMPQVLGEGKRKVLTPADQKLLEDMERRYMKVAREPAPASDPAAPAPATPASSSDPAPAAPTPTPATP